MLIQEEKEIPYYPDSLQDSSGSVNPEIYARMTENGESLFRIFPNSRIVSVDLDNNTWGWLPTLEDVQTKLGKTLYVHRVLSVLSKSGFGTHLYLLFLEPVPTDTAIAIAGVLGGDMKRELHSVRRYHQGHSYPWLMIESRDSAKALRTWLRENGVEHEILEYHPAVDVPF